MAKTLEEQVQERIQQAKDRNIIEKIRVVVERLGVPVKYENDDVKKMEIIITATR